MLFFVVVVVLFVVFILLWFLFCFCLFFPFIVEVFVGFFFVFCWFFVGLVFWFGFFLLFFVNQFIFTNTVLTDLQMNLSNVIAFLNKDPIIAEIRRNNLLIFLSPSDRETFLFHLYLCKNSIRWSTVHPSLGGHLRTRITSERLR